MDTLPLFARFETILGVIPGATDRDRILIAKIVSPGDVDLVEMRQQSFGDGVGWFTQSSIPLMPDQVTLLGNTLKSGMQDSPAKKKRTAASLQNAKAHGLALVR